MTAAQSFTEQYGKTISFWRVVFFAFTILMGSGVESHAQDCSQTNPPTCSYVTNAATAAITPTAFTPLSTYACKNIINSCGADIMVPTGSEAEWASFLTNHEACVSTSDCDRYSWSAGGWGNCSASCGGGTQTQTVTCQQTDIDTNTVTTVANNLCPASTEPSTSQSCNTQACVTYAWGGWSSCSASGTQTRSCDGSDGSTGNDASLCGGSASQSCTPTATVWVQFTGGGNYAYYGAWTPGSPEADSTDTFSGYGNGGNPYANDLGASSLYAAAARGMMTLGGSMGWYGGCFTTSAWGYSGHGFSQGIAGNCPAGYANRIQCSYLPAVSTGAIGHAASVGWDNITYADPYGPAGTTFNVWYCGAPAADIRGVAFFTIQ